MVEVRSFGHMLDGARRYLAGGTLEMVGCAARFSSCERAEIRAHGLRHPRVLNTGGAGFIGSQIADQLIEHEGVGEVRLPDNMLRGSRGTWSQLWPPGRRAWWKRLLATGRCSTTRCPGSTTCSTWRRFTSPMRRGPREALEVMYGGTSTWSRAACGTRSGSWWRSRPRRSTATQKPIGPGDQTMDYNAVEDVVRASILAMKAPVSDEVFTTWRVHESRRCVSFASPSCGLWGRRSSPDTHPCRRRGRPRSASRRGSPAWSAGRTRSGATSEPGRQ
jgi:hypothetical protein